jgi:SH3-like domain-containing protein
MIMNRHHLLLTRVLPLAVVGLGVAALIPSDFKAAANTIQQAVPQASAPSRVEINVPKPTLIATATATPQVQVNTPQVQTVQAAGTLPAGAQVPPPGASSDGVGTTLPDGLRDGRVGGSDVNVRADASAGSAILFTLPAGTAVRLGDAQGGWARVYTDTGSGWVYSGLLANGSNLTAQIRRAEPQSRPLSGAVRLRGATAVYDRPGGSRLYTLDGGERVSIAQSSGGWARIITDTDESGWIRI